MEIERNAPSWHYTDGWTTWAPSIAWFHCYPVTWECSASIYQDMEDPRLCHWEFDMMCTTTCSLFRGL